MSFRTTPLEGVTLVEPKVYRDHRGFFLETYHAERYRDGGITETFVQDNHSRSGARTLRGLHSQRQQPQGKLVRAIEGEIWDIAVDIRVGSPTFCQWFAAVLSADNFHQLYVPPGFAHGFCVLSESAQVEYKCTDFYAPADELGLRWDDPAFGIEWPIADPVLSDKDRDAPLLDTVMDLLPRYQPG